jgi:hypothetical protein
MYSEHASKSVSSFTMVLVFNRHIAPMPVEWREVDNAPLPVTSHSTTTVWC